MARSINSRPLGPIINAGQLWINSCLIQDGSILSGGHLWTSENVAEVKVAFVDHPDLSKEAFIPKLKLQMSNASSPAKQLMAEMLWALFLFPSNVSAAKKLDNIREIWTLSAL